MLVGYRQTPSLLISNLKETKLRINCQTYTDSFKSSLCVCSVARSRPTLCNPMVCSPPGSSVHGIFQVRVLEWVAISSSKGSSPCRERTWFSGVSFTGRQIHYHLATREAQVITVFVYVQSLSCVQLFATSWTAVCQASQSFTTSQGLLKLMVTESVMPSNHLILCHPFLLLSSNFPSIRAFYNESALSIRWPKYWSFSFSINPSNEHSGLNSFRIDWFDLLAVQGTLESSLTLQLKNINSLALNIH